MSTEITSSALYEMISAQHKEILTEWIAKLLADKSRTKAVSDASLQTTAKEFLGLLQTAAKSGGSDMNSNEWETVRQMLGELSASRAIQGSTPAETANFVFSLKQVLFSKLSAKNGQTADALGKEFWPFLNLLDQLGLYTTEVFQKSREAVIRRQQKEMLEMSTPVIKLWDGILVVPLIGTLDSARTQIVMETLLEQIVATGSQIAILDITGVPTVDTETAQHLIKTVSATRLMGADCIISGIRPQIAQTIVHLGIDIYDITTKATMSDAVKEALKRNGWELKQHSTDNER